MAKAKRRLTNIRTKEVSLVDEAANLRRFIVVKRKGVPMGKKNAELLKDDDSTVLKISADVKETLTSQGNQVIEKMKEALEKVETIEVCKDAKDDVPGEVIDQFDEVLKSMPKFDEEEIEDFGISKSAEEIKKAGKKISSSRLQKISAAFTILSGLLEELGHKENDSSTTKNHSNDDSHGGGNSMTKPNEETKKRSPEISFTLAEAEVIKTREALEVAEEAADAAGITKAKEEVSKANDAFSVAKSAKEEAEKTSEVEKAQKIADEAAANLKKAKGEPVEPKNENADILKQILEGQKATQEKLELVTSENAELKKQLEEVSKSAQPSNSTDGDAGGQNTSDEKTEKSKIGKAFWGGHF